MMGNFFACSLMLLIIAIKTAVKAMSSTGYGPMILKDYQNLIACLGILEICHPYNHLNDRFILSISRLNYNRTVRTAYYVVTDTH